MLPRFALIVLVACGGGTRGTGTSGSTPAVAVSPGDIVIANVSVVSMSHDGVLEHRTVVVRGDASGHRVFAVTTTIGTNVVPGELVVDADGFVVAQTIGPPLNLTFTRRP